MEAVTLKKSSENCLDLLTKNFIDTIRSRKTEELHAPIQIGSDVATLSHMGNIAYRTEKKIYWNKEK